MLEKKGKLISLESVHNKLEKDVEYIGTCPFLPQVGYRFLFYFEPLDNIETRIRYVETGTIQEVDHLYEKIWEFKTKRSTYRLEVE